MHEARASLTERVADRLKAAGLRPTVQRVQLGKMIWGEGGNRHLSAECLLTESRLRNVQVSLATIYNTLHQFTDAGLLKELVLEGGRTFFDTNTEHHHHFLFVESGEVQDIPSSDIALSCLPTPPLGSEVMEVEVMVKIRRRDSL